MVGSYFVGDTIDDVMREAIESILQDGHKNNATKGSNAELFGVLLELKNPRARISKTETRGKPFSCLGELCWYLSGENDLNFITYYIPRYAQWAEDGILYGAYGPRLLDRGGLNQIENVLRLLKSKPGSRRAVIQLFDATDIDQDHEDVPCTCTTQLVLRENILHMITYMRSNDAFWGLPHDIFSFTMLQEIFARALSAELGSYKHAVGSLHLYDKQIEDAQEFLKEGWQPTDTPMPPMPTGDPGPSIQTLLRVEEIIRNDRVLDSSLIHGLDPYWLDLVRLLQVLKYAKNKDQAGIEALRREMSSNTYRPFIDKMITRISE